MDVDIVLDPDLPICDAHHHLWDRPGNRYLPDDFRQDMGGHKIVKTVFMGCKTGYRDAGSLEMRPVGETEFIQSITAPFAAGTGTPQIAAAIVGSADLMLGAAVEPVLEAHIAAGKGRFRGIRKVFGRRNSIITGLASGTFELDRNFKAGVACLVKHGLTLDAWAPYPQLEQMALLARACPDVSIIVDHVGGPFGAGANDQNYRDAVLKWRQDIREIAKYQNVAIKMGGLGMPVFGFGWDGRDRAPDSNELAAAMAPYFLWCIESFGVNRCMFESNFPPDKISFSYTTLWNAFKRVTRDFSAAERTTLFHDSATRIYRLAY